MIRNKDSEIQCLQDTLQILEKGYYEKNGRRVELKLSKKEMEECIVLLPEDVIKHSNDPGISNPPIPFVLGRCGHGCENTDSFTMARKHYKDFDYIFDDEKKKEILVLNMANPVHPGGGVRNGARAQEEDLCRKSSLLLSLESRKAEKYYDYNRRLDTRMGSDAMIFTPKVEIIKDENGNLLDETVIVSVLTCAAPMVSFGKEGMSEKQYQEMVYNRIMGMLKCSAYFGYKMLVLGAWGCGAFGNDARVISNLFYKALKDLNYNRLREKDLFRRVDFAVLDKTEDQYNFKEFCRNFAGDNFYRDENQEEIDKAQERIKETEVYLDRIRGCMIGGAIGDALGYPVEFLDEEELIESYGEGGIKEYDLDPFTGKALISDDTQMTLFTANGLLVGDTRGEMRGIQGNPRDYVAMSYQDWLRTQEMTFEDGLNLMTDADLDKNCNSSWLSGVKELYSWRAPGKTCLSSLAIRNDGEYVDDYIRNPVNNSKGCGGVMRIAPQALDYKPGDIEWLDMEGAQIAAITHGNSLGYMPAAVLTHIISRIVYPDKERSLKEIIIEARNTVEKLFKDDKHINELTSIIDLAVKLAGNNDSDLNNINRIGEGWVAEETLAIAIYCTLRYKNDFSGGIIAAVNHKGDSDSTGAVTGNILGALLGYEAIEDKWKSDLELKEVILEMADDVCYGCQMSEYSSYRDNDWARKYFSMCYTPEQEKEKRRKEEEYWEKKLKSKSFVR